SEGKDELGVDGARTSGAGGGAEQRLDPPCPFVRTDLRPPYQVGLVENTNQPPCRIDDRQRAYVPVDQELDGGPPAATTTARPLPPVTAEQPTAPPHRAARIIEANRDWRHHGPRARPGPRRPAVPSRRVTIAHFTTIVPTMCECTEQKYL